MTVGAGDDQAGTDVIGDLLQLHGGGFVLLTSATRVLAAMPWRASQKTAVFGLIERQADHPVAYVIGSLRAARCGGI
ncbi:hypothetical protein ABID59_004533 [Bradyrhizobium sp. S3.3.6]